MALTGTLKGTNTVGYYEIRISRVERNYQHCNYLNRGRYSSSCLLVDRLCGLVVRVLGYRSGGPGSIPGTRKKK
jgi:hypothetical protein